MSQHANSLIAAYADQSRYSAIGQTAQMLAHDVRKPFSQLQALLDNVDSYHGHPQLLQNAKKEINQSIKNVESMIADIMDFSREMAVEKESVVLSGVLDFSIRQSVAAFVLHQKKPAIDFTYDLHHTHKPLMDEARMARVFGNIVGNGLEAIVVLGKRNYGKMWVTSRDVTFVENMDSGVEVVIGNDGPCFAEEDIPRLFDSFFTKGKKKGTGLGLASVEKVIRLHGGSASARNHASGKGVEFVLRLPASEELESYTVYLPPSLDAVLCCAALSRPETDAQEKAYDGWESHIGALTTPLKVLLLEDEGLYRAAVKKVVSDRPLLSQKIEFYDAVTVEEALGLLSRFLDLRYAIVDIDLGDMQNGFEFLKSVKEAFPQLRCMVHSNRCTEDDKNLAKQLGASAFVSKPLSAYSLVAFLSEGMKAEQENCFLPKQGALTSSAVCAMPEKSNFPTVDNPPAVSLLYYVADDSPLMRMALKKHLSTLLEERGCSGSIRAFETGEALVAAVEEEAPDVVFSDYHFDSSPMTGVEALEQIKQQHPHAKCFLVSNITQEEGAQWIARLGLSGFIQPGGDLKAALKAALERFLAP